MSRPWIVLKFGGSSVAEASLWQTIADVVEQRIQQGYRPLLVLSALKNVSNRLEALLHKAMKGTHQEEIDALQTHHSTFSKALGLDLEGSLTNWFESLKLICDNIYQIQQITPQAHAQVVAFGELLSSTIGAAFLNSKGTQVTWCDARNLLKTTNKSDPWHHFTAAQCEYANDPALNDNLTTLKGVIVTQGFIAADENQQTVLLGREGSDTSAAYFGAKLNAIKIEIWTDVPGVFSSNPREIDKARQIPFLDYAHAHLLAKFGAKVLHPRALAPAEKYRIPLWVKCTKLPQAQGTEISNNSTQSMPVAQNNTCALATLSDVYYFKFEADDSLTKQVTNQLLSLGFDKITEFNQNGTRYLLMQYNNSDLKAPSDTHIRQHISLNVYESHHNLTLISLLGFAVTRNWNNFLDSFLRETITAPVIQIFNTSTTPIYALLVQQNDSRKIAAQLHLELIESNTEEGLFSKSWQHFEISL